MKKENFKILLIEDNDDHAELITRSFEDNSISVALKHVSDGEAAIEYVMGTGKYGDRNHYPMPDLILLDLRLPKIDGLEVLEKIKNTEDLKHVPVVVLTSSDNDKDIHNAYKNYVNSYLVKPLDFNKFTNLMQDLGYY